MGQEMISYLQRLEIMAFFSGYPFVYLIILSIAGKPANRTVIKKRLVSILSFSYSITGILYLGFQLRNLYPDYSVAHVNSAIQNLYLAVWGLLSVLFWLPVLRKKPVFSLLHSLVFFYLLLKDIYFQTTSPSFEKSILKNDMNIYTNSILLNAAAFAVTAILYLIIIRFKKRSQPAL